MTSSACAFVISSSGVGVLASCTSVFINAFDTVAATTIAVADAVKRDGEVGFVGTGARPIVVGSREGNAGRTVVGRGADSTTGFTGHAGVVVVHVVTVHAHTDAFG